MVNKSGAPSVFPSTLRVEESNAMVDRLAERHRRGRNHGATARAVERLRQAVDEYRMTEMGRSMAKGKRIAPTHPHPHAPPPTPGVTIADAAAGLGP